MHFKGDALYLPKHEYLDRHRVYNDEKKKLLLDRTYATNQTKKTRNSGDIYKQNTYMKDN